MAERRKKDLRQDPAYPLLREFKLGIVPRDSLALWGGHSIGIGRKIVDGEETDQLALRIYVAKKRPSAQLSPREEVPKTISFLPRKAKRRRRLLTDVIETPRARFQPVDPETRIRPVPGGVSGGTAAHTGTIGGWVWDMTDDTIVMLSNDHVFGHTAGVDILQQGAVDGGSLPVDKTGDVKRGIARSTVVNNVVDCAIGDPDSSDIYDLSVLEIGPAVYAIEVPHGDMLVEKYGQTTRHTFGEITDIDWEGLIDGAGGPYYFEDCFRVDPVAPTTDWSAGGDSGSLVFSQTPIPDTDGIKPVVGLHFAGGGTHGIECKIQTVFNRLDLTTLCDGACAAFSESLFGAEMEGEVSEEAEARLRTVSALATRIGPLAFVRKERSKYRARSFYSGISRDIQKRLMTSERGRVITDFVDQNRAELLTLLTTDGDIRRATVAAIRPLVAGATTTTDVLERAVTAEDLERLEKLGRELARKGGPRLQEALERLMALRPEAEGESLARILKIEL
jgi:hypothetical protein